MSGYSRFSKLSDMDILCLDSDACEGGKETVSSISKCKEGYEGLLCSQCSTNYFKTIDGKCNQCENMTLNVLYSFGLIIFFSVNITLAIKGTIQNVYVQRVKLGHYMKLRNRSFEPRTIQ